LLSPGELFHAGIVVADLERAMAELSARVYEWAQPLARPVDVLTPDRAPRTVEGSLTYSLAPLRLELIQAATGTPWPTEEIGAVHHLGYWVPDLKEGLRLAEEAGWKREWAGAGAAGDAARFVYLRLPETGVRIELVDRAAIGDDLERWWSGGAYRP